MKKVIAPLIILVCCLAVLFLQPIQLQSDTGTRLTIHVGKTVPVQEIAELSGGYRCYVNDREYFWLSAKDTLSKTGDRMKVVFQLRGPATVYTEVYK